MLIPVYLQFGHTRPHTRPQPKFGLWPSLWPNVWPKNKNRVLLVSYAYPLAAHSRGQHWCACHQYHTGGSGVHFPMAPALGPRQSGASGGFGDLYSALFQPRTTALPSPVHSLWADSGLLRPHRHLRAPRAPRRRRRPDAHRHRRHRRHRRRHLRPLRCPSRRLERGGRTCEKSNPRARFGLWCGCCRSPLALHWPPRWPSPSHALSTTYLHPLGSHAQVW